MLAPEQVHLGCTFPLGREHRLAADRSTGVPSPCGIERGVVEKMRVAPAQDVLEGGIPPARTDHEDACRSVSYTHLTLPTTPYV